MRLSNAALDPTTLARALDQPRGSASGDKLAVFVDDPRLGRVRIHMVWFTGGARGSQPFWRLEHAETIK
jgi:hypothetical protein